MSLEKTEGAIDWFSNKPITTGNNTNLLTNSPWNPVYSNPQDQVAGTLLQELTEAMYPNQSETESRELENLYIEQSEKAKKDGTP
jgi:hypothetical protein